MVDPGVTAIVTGASAGIGRAVARRLHDEGYGLTIAARGRDPLAELAEALGPERVAVHEYDAADPDAAPGLVESHLERFGGLAVVVANAGLGRPGGAAAFGGERLDSMYAVNVRAAFALAAASMPSLRASAAAGRSSWFIVTSSIVGVGAEPGFAGYGAMKAAQMGLARSINVEEASSGVRASAICPAFVSTAMSEWVRDRIAPIDMLDPDDVASAVGFLLGLSRPAVVPEIVLGRAGAPHPLAP